ncbi:hypothetical protein [Agrobacterium tumefaciens]|uniref:hypothetical protein n=1 Tax=Agrobacterium tumefaciens TaxID=358 RepID=UPI001F19590E
MAASRDQDWRLAALGCCGDLGGLARTRGKRPPSKSIKRDYVEELRGTIKPGDFTKAEISSVVLLDPERRIYAFCTRTAERADPNWSYIGVASKHNVSVDASKNDFRCRDKRLRYYDFPELLNMKF